MKMINKNTTDVYITYDKLFWLYLTGCVAGVIIEGVFCLVTKGHWESHVVSVFGAFNVLYGFGAVLLYAGAVKLKDKNIFVRVVLLTMTATILEFFSGLLLKYGLGMRAWNYENKFLNYKGLICISFSIIWGVAAFIICKIYPYINICLNKLKGRKWNIACAAFTIVLAVDLILTSVAMVRWSERHYGISPIFKIAKQFDMLAPDEWMQTRFMEWKFLK